MTDLPPKTIAEIHGGPRDGTLLEIDLVLAWIVLPDEEPTEVPKPAKTSKYRMQWMVGAMRAHYYYVP